MSDDFKVNTLLLKQRSPLQSANQKNDINFDINNQIPSEVFRNKTTAVEVIVKQINNKTKIKEPSKVLDEVNVDSLYEEIEKLKTELNSANTNLELSKKCFTVVMFEMGRQLEAANQRDLKRQTKNLVLQLEKEKLKTILGFKTNLVSKLRKEMLNMKRIIKTLSKSVRTLLYMPENVNTDSEYTEFENDLLKPKRKIVNSLTDDIMTYETTMSSPNFCDENHTMFSLCRRYKDEHEHGGTQIKGGYMLRYKRKYLWNTWSEEWVVLYDDSTMAWFKDASGKCMATQKHLVKESPEMLAISSWTGQVPKRPPLPLGSKLSQLMALGSRRHPGHVVWMLAKSDSEMKEWMAAISKTLPPPPHIELVMSMPYLRTAFKRPTVRVRPTSSSDLYARSSRNAVGALDGRGLVAVIKRQVPLAGQLDHELAWGQGWGWVTLPNGAWSGRLTWSQEGDDFALHAMPIMHHTNVSQACSMLDGVTAYEASAYEQALSEYDDAATTSDDWDFGVDCGDFMM